MSLLLLQVHCSSPLLGVSLLGGGATGGRRQLQQEELKSREQEGRRNDLKQDQKVA